MTSPLASEVGRFDHGKKPSLFLSACPQVYVGQNKFWLAGSALFKILKTGLFISVWPCLPSCSLPPGPSVLIRAVPGEEMRSDVFVFQMCPDRALSLWPFS